MPVAATENKYRVLPPDTMMQDFKNSGFASTGTGLIPGALGERVLPVPTYLASSACTVNGEAFSAVAGRYSRVFVGVTKGWLSETDSFPTAEDFAAHLDEIEDRSEFVVPKSIYDELAAVQDARAERDGAATG
jgi:hypothetical protein